jgi:hypothetical protein
MNTRIIAASLGLLFAAAYAAPQSSPQLRVTPDEVDAMRAHESGAGTSGAAVVVTGVWYFGYGPIADAGAEKALPAGSFYTEPGGVAHFAETKADSVLVYISGYGPTDTVYVKANDEHGLKQQQKN